MWNSFRRIRRHICRTSYFLLSNGHHLPNRVFLISEIFRFSNSPFSLETPRSPFHAVLHVPFPVFSNSPEIPVEKLQTVGFDSKLTNFTAEDTRQVVSNLADKEAILSLRFVYSYRRLLRGKYFS